MKVMPSRHSMSRLADCLVFRPKHRGAILKPAVREAVRLAILRVCDNMGLEVIRMAVGKDGVFIFYRYPPKYSVSEIARNIKGGSSRRVRKRFPGLRKRWPEGLWSPGCFHGAVGQGAEVVVNYIKSQEGLSLEERIERLRRRY